MLEAFGLTGIVEKEYRMKTCKNCGLTKELSEYYKSPNSKDGFHGQCKDCIKSKSKRLKPSKKKSKEPVIKYRKTKGLILPDNPIPIKFTTEDGFGGKWKFDMNKLKQHLNFAKQQGQKNHMVNRKFKCWQVKSTDVIAMRVFCDYIGMSRQAIITFDKPDKSVYVVNLYHPDILKVVNNANP